MGDGQIRAFIAIELPNRVRSALGREADRLREVLGDAALRWVRPDGIHLTLRFLGDTSGGMLDQVAAALAPLCARCPPLEIEIGGLGRFPNGSRPRVVWIGVKESPGQLAILQAEIEHGMAGLSFRKEDRPFHPHLTVARVRRETPAQELRMLAERLDRERVGLVGEFSARQLALMRSVLGPGGAAYSRLQQFKLTGAP